MRLSQNPLIVRKDVGVSFGSRIRGGRRRSKGHDAFLTTRGAASLSRDDAFSPREAIKIWIKIPRRMRKRINTPAARAEAQSGGSDKRLRVAGKFIRVTGVLPRRRILLRPPFYLRHAVGS